MHIENFKVPYSLIVGYITSGKVQFFVKVMRVEEDDIVKILTLLTVNTLVKVAVCDNDEQYYQTGD